MHSPFFPIFLDSEDEADQRPSFGNSAATINATFATEPGKMIKSGTKRLYSTDQLLKMSVTEPGKMIKSGTKMLSLTDQLVQRKSLTGKIARSLEQK
jgi:hypothetical protein